MMPIEHTKTAARHLRDELEASYPETCKVPSCHGGYIRVAISINAEWYRRFCRQYLSTQRRYPRPRTFIKRCHTLAALNRIAEGNMKGIYTERLLPFIEEHVERLLTKATPAETPIPF